MTINLGGVQQLVGHLACTRLIAPRADGLTDVRQADEAQLTSPGLCASRSIRCPMNIESAHPIGRTLSACRARWRLGYRRT